MTIRARILPTLHLGVALAADRLVAVLPGGESGDPWRRALAPPPDPSMASPDLGTAFAELREALRQASHGGTRRAVLHVALLPPFAHWRRITMPGLRIDEARQVLRREPSRYLPIAADPAPLVIELEGTGWRERSPFTMIAAPRALIEGIQAAAEQSGWEIAELVAAHAAWAASAAPSRAAGRSTERTLLIAHHDRIDVVKSRGGCATELRRLPAALRAIIPDSPTAVHAPDAVAARFAPRAGGPALVPEGVRAIAERRTRMAAITRLAAAAALLFAAGMIELWGSARERSMIAGERARLHASVTEALATREAAAQATNRLATVRRAAGSAPRWSALLASLAETLPDDAFLVALGASGDSLRIEGIAPRAAPVFDAVARVDGIRSIRPEGAIRQERTIAGATSERFTLTASMGGRP